MKTEINLSNFSIPYGVLHDQKLVNAKIDDSELILTFDVEIFEQNYTDLSVYNQFKDFKHCDMKIKLSSPEDNSFSLITSIDKNNKFSGVELSFSEFLSLPKIADEITFLSCLTNGYEVKIDFTFSLYNADINHKKLKKYSSLTAELYSSNIILEWY